MSGLNDTSNESVRLRNSLRRAGEQYPTATLDGVRLQIQSGSADARLEALMIGQMFAEDSASLEDFVNEARAVLRSDPDEDCRWQAAILIGMFIDEDPEGVWRVAEEFGGSSESLVRTIVATTLLEHLPATYRTRAEALARTSEYFRETLRMCW